MLLFKILLFVFSWPLVPENKMAFKGREPALVMLQYSKVLFKFQVPVVDVPKTIIADELYPEEPVILQYLTSIF